MLLVSARRSAYARHERVGKLFTSICLYEIVVWGLYALVWGLADENQLLSVDVEIILFAMVRVKRRRKPDSSLMFWQRECLADGYWWSIIGFRSVMFQLLDGG